jgi:hypothetical protein
MKEFKEWDQHEGEWLVGVVYPDGTENTCYNDFGKFYAALALNRIFSKPLKILNMHFVEYQRRIDLCNNDENETTVYNVVNYVDWSNDWVWDQIDPNCEWDNDNDKLKKLVLKFCKKHHISLSKVTDDNGVLDYDRVCSYYATPARVWDMVKMLAENCIQEAF